MRQSRGALFFGLVGVVVVVALVARSLPSHSTRTAAPTAMPPVAVVPLRQVAPQQPPNQQPTNSVQSAVMVPTPTALLAGGAPTATPPAISASELEEGASNQQNQSAAAPAAEHWNPPSLEVPLARQPFDHFWFIRPVTSDHTNYGLSWYLFGSNGPANDLRIHHGIDMPNPVGVPVHAAGDGTVVVAGHGFETAEEKITAYGNVIAIEHDFGYEGQPLFTLYAHLSAFLVKPGDHVTQGQIIGLIGATGQVSGPHVHFEVRVGHDRYNSVHNPVLWMAPYVGTGVIAGRIEFDTGTTVNDLTVDAISLATGQTAFSTSTYAGPGVNADDNWHENFAFPDVPVGQYFIKAAFGTTTWSGQVDVQEGMINWVEMERHTAGEGDSPGSGDSTSP